MDQSPVRSPNTFLRAWTKKRGDRVRQDKFWTTLDSPFVPIFGLQDRLAGRMANFWTASAGNLRLFSSCLAPARLLFRTCSCPVFCYFGEILPCSRPARKGRESAAGARSRAPLGRLKSAEKQEKQAVFGAGARPITPIFLQPSTATALEENLFDSSTAVGPVADLDGDVASRTTCSGVPRSRPEPPARTLGP